MIFLSKKNKKDVGKEEYGYDFVPELSHITNIDEQRVKAKKMEKMGKDKHAQNG